MSTPLRDQYNRVSAASVKKHTGKDWRGWFTILEKRGAGGWEHRELVAYLAREHKLTPWWQQMVAVGFEIYTGRRIEGRNLKGTWSATISKAMWRPAREVWNFMMGAEGLPLWLEPLDGFRLVKGATFEIAGGVFGEVRGFLTPRRLRLRLQDTEQPRPWTLQLWVIDRPGGRSIIVFTPEGLASARERLRQRERWRAACERLAAALPPRNKTPAAPKKSRASQGEKPRARTRRAPRSPLK